MLVINELRTTRRASELNENRPPEGGRRFRVVAGARYADIRDLGSIEILLGSNEL
mgnify:CR=1 FL=1